MLGAFHDIADDADPMGAKHIILGKTEPPEAGDVHIHPDAALVVKQLVAEKIGERRIGVFADPGFRILARGLENPFPREDFVGIAQENADRQWRFQRVIYPQMKLVPEARERPQRQLLQPRERLAYP
ncbi:MAG: hypothetical protein ABSD21_03595 [Rhizomicrobium sp.]